MKFLSGLFPRLAAFSIALACVGGLHAAAPAAPQKSEPRRFAVAGIANPRALAIDAAGVLYVVDIDSTSVQKISPNGAAAPLATTGIQAPFAVAVSRAGEIYISDTDNNTVFKLAERGATAIASGVFSGPTSLAVDVMGNVFVTDNGNAVIRKITPKGEVTVFAGQPGETGAKDGAGGAARFVTPRGIAIDPAGNLYVADEGNSNIRKLTPAGVVTTLAGLAGSPGSQNGTGTSAQFGAPRGLAVDAAGNVYVADTDNHTIRKITPAGAVTTLAGLVGAVGNTDGPGDNARFSEPRGIAVDAAGNVFVADTGNAAIRQISPARVVTTVAGTQPR
jgi:DNA-binding beta-propeller fold protein YncE